jgi:hypothetical protein
MSSIDPAFAYAQARLQARFGMRPSGADWSHIAATADLGALLQVLRSTPLSRWTSRLAPRPGTHDIERRLRQEWLDDVDEVASWQPEPWREGIRWLRWIVYLPALQKLARGGRVPAWMRDDAVLGPIVAREPRERAASLRHTPMAPLAQAFEPTGSVAGAWLAQWQRLWPQGHAGRRALEALLGTVTGQGALLAGLPVGSQSSGALHGLERRFELTFRRNPLSPAATVAYLGLLALDLRRLRGALAVRAIGERTAGP